MTSKSSLDARLLERLLSDVRFVSRLVVSDSVGSTNDELRRLANEGAEEGTVVIAAAQTAGRGRMGRHWHSPPGRGLYLSVLLHPREPLSQVTRWTLAAAVAACRACRELSGCPVAIEWPNDLAIGERKLAGVLAEVRSAAGRIELVLGIGFNVLQRAEDFPTELSERSTSLYIASGRTNLGRERLAALYLSELGRTAGRMREGGWSAVAAEWCRLAPGAHGRRVRILAGTPKAPATPWDGVTRGIDDDGALLVERADGGTASIRMIDAVIPLEA